MKNNYRVDVFRKLIDGSVVHYKIKFPEYWLAKTFADAIKCADGVKNVFILKRLIDDKSDVKEEIK